MAAPVARGIENGHERNLSPEKRDFHPHKKRKAEEEEEEELCLTHETAQREWSSANPLHQIQPHHGEQEVDCRRHRRQPYGCLVTLHSGHPDDRGAVVPVNTW